MATVKTLPGDDTGQLTDAQITGTIRKLSLLRAWHLRERFDAAISAAEREEIRTTWAEESGRDVDKDLRWTELLTERDLRAAFRTERIGESEWLLRLEAEHLYRLSFAKDLKTNQLLSSPKLAELAVEVYHRALKPAEVPDFLREKGHLPPATSRAGIPTPKGHVMASVFLRWLAAHLEETGRDFDITALMGRYFDLTISRDLPWWQRRVADLWERVGPKTTWRP